MAEGPHILPNIPKSAGVKRKSALPYEPVCAIFRRYLHGQKLKFTPERAMMLDAVLRRSGLFEAEQLVADLKQLGHRVSRDLTNSIFSERAGRRNVQTRRENAGDGTQQRAINVASARIAMRTFLPVNRCLRRKFINGCSLRRYEKQLLCQPDAAADITAARGGLANNSASATSVCDCEQVMNVGDVSQMQHYME